MLAELRAKERTDSDRRVEGRGITGELRAGGVKSRNMYIGPIDEDGRGRGGLNVGGGGWKKICTKKLTLT